MSDHNEIYSALKKHFGFDNFKGQQLEIISSLLDGDNVFVVMPTGGGKSLCYQLPALMSEGTAIVISPLIALMKNQVDAVRHFEEQDNVAHFLNSSLSKSAASKVREDVQSGKTKLLYVAPESLSKEENINFLKTIKISFVAVDEAHCISEWGHDFRPEYRRIRTMLSAIGNFPVIALTATATPKVQYDIMKNLGISNAKIFKLSFNRPNLYYEVRPKTSNVDKDIIRFIKNNENKSGIIYCLSRKKVEELAETLKINDIRALPYHAGMDSTTRSVNQDAFLNEDVNVIVATIAFGMGIDKPDVRFVIHYDIPKSLEGYYQETGRAGRDGGEGKCITFYTRKDLQKLEKLLQSKPVSEQEIGKHLLTETADYAESSVCRRKILLHYFGEAFSEPDCGNCDNCRHPRRRIDATEEARTALLAVKETGECHKIEYVVNFLIGRATDELKHNHHENSEHFGALEEMGEKSVGMLVRQLIIASYLRKDLENYGILKLTPEGESYIRKPENFVLIEDEEYYESLNAEDVSSGMSAALDPHLFSILKSLRKDIAKRQNIPPYLVFLDQSLEGMSTLYPVTLEELLTVPGVGSGKATRYGKEFLEVISRYVDEFEIERPHELRIKSMANKSNPKISIIQAIDRKIDLDEVCESMDMEFSDFLSELESIVEAGTKIDIGYFVKDVLDEDLVNEITEYFKSSEDGNLENAIQTLGRFYDDDDIRLVRVKFISDVGN